MNKKTYTHKKKTKKKKQVYSCQKIGASTVSNARKTELLIQLKQNREK